MNETGSQHSLVEKETERTAGGDHPPAAAAVTPPTSDADQKKPLTFEQAGETPDLRERGEKKEIRYPDPISKALGCVLFITNWSEVGWKLRTGQAFAVTRYYKPIKVAVDFPRDAEAMRFVNHKRTVLRALGIAYVYIAPDHSKSTAELQVEIEEERKMLAQEET